MLSRIPTTIRSYQIYIYFVILSAGATSLLLPEADAGGHLWFASGDEHWVSQCRQQQDALRQRRRLTSIGMTSRTRGSPVARTARVTCRAEAATGSGVSDPTAGISLETAMQCRCRTCRSHSNSPWK